MHDDEMGEKLFITFEFHYFTPLHKQTLRCLNYTIAVGDTMSYKEK